MEVAELIDHLNWKWWKEKKEINKVQLKIEVIDIFHFMVSEAIVSRLNPIQLPTFPRSSENKAGEELQGSLFDGDDQAEEIDEKVIISKAIDLTTEQPLAKRFEGFYSLCKEVGLDFEGLFSIYKGKNVLNNFRQDHGYNNGTYTKKWQGVEDNEILYEIVLTSKITDPEDIYAELGKAYSVE